ncbi:unnamed protein product [Caenorhabditis brenneri]
MLKRTTFDSVVFLTPALFPPSIPTLFEDAQIIFQASDNMPNVYDFEQVLVPAEHCDVLLFYDEIDENVYLTNFVFDQSLLNYPVQLVVVFNDDVQIYVGQKQLVLMSSQTQDDLKTESFYFQLYGTVAPMPIGTQKKVYVESHDFIGDDGESVDLGLRSEVRTVVSEYDDSISDTSTNDVADVDQLSAQLQKSPDLEMQLPSAIRNTCQDEKKKRQDKMKVYRILADSVLSAQKIKYNEIPVSPDLLILSRDFDPEDSTIQRIYDGFDKKNPSLSDPDPIVVCECDDGKFKVISGNRRVAACQKKSMKKIYVSTIESAESDTYAMTHFFVSQTKDDHDINYLLNILNTLLEKMDLSAEIVSKWTCAEKSMVFGGLFGPMSKMRFLLDFSAEKELIDDIIRLAGTGHNFSNHTFREIQRRYRQNPTNVSILMKKNWESDMALRKELTKVTLDLKYRMVQKKVSQSVADDLCSLYEDDEAFGEFIRHVIYFINLTLQI